MAELLPALIETKGVEAVYSNHPLDPGKETVWGISRAFHPELVELWLEVDRLKGSPDFLVQLNGAKVQGLVDDYYKANEWGAVCGALIPHQMMAEELFDTAVNIGPTFTIQFLQLTMNPLNRGGLLFADLEVDGRMGPDGDTLKALLTMLKELDGFRLVWQGLNSWQDCYYQMGGKDVWQAILPILKAAVPDPKREAFIRGLRLKRAFNSKAAKAVFS